MPYGLLAAPFVATDPNAFEEMGSLLHDETMELDDVRYDATDGVLTIPFRRQFHDGPERILKDDKSGKIIEKDWMRSTVIIRGVTSWKVIEDQEIGDYTFNEWEWNPGQIILYLCEQTTVEIASKVLNVCMTDEGFSGKARLSYGVGGGELSTHEIF